MEGDFVLVAHEEFHAGEKLCLRWCGRRRITKALNDYVYCVKDLRDGINDYVHVSRLKFYHDSSLDKEAIMPHVLNSETETWMVIHRLLRLVENGSGIYVVVRWRGLPESEDTLEPLVNIYKDVPQLLLKLQLRKSTPQTLAQKARHELQL